MRLTFQIGVYYISIMKPHKAKSGPYRGEITLLGDRYPVTKKGKVSCNRVRAAIAFGTMHDDLPQLRKHGLGYYVQRCQINSKLGKI